MYNGTSNSIGRRKREIVLVFIWLVMVVAATCPPILNNEFYYGVVKYAVLFMMLLISLSCTFFKAFRHAFIRRLLVIVVLTGVMFLALRAFHFRPSWSDPINLFIIVWAISLGYRIALDNASVERFILLYGILSILLGIYSLVFYTGTVSLSTYEYAVNTKNQVGQILATGAIGLLIVSASSRKYYYLKLVLVALSIILLFILRCRTALLAYLVMFVLFVHRQFKFNYKVLLVYGVMIFVLLFSSRINSFFGRVFVGLHDIDDINSLSANRMDRNIAGIAFIGENPIWGELKVPSNIENIHNYIIKRVVLYGLFSIPILVFYFVFLVRLVKGWFKSSFSVLENAGLYMLFIPFFSSMLEPSAPFGPGLVQVIPFFFYGLFLNRSNKRGFYA